MDLKNDENLKKSQFQNELFEEQINLKEVFSTFKRGKNFILIITSAGFILGCFYALLQKRIWQGQFQIVLSKEEDLSKLAKQVSSNRQIAGLLGVSLGKSDQKTEIEILKSPSVLMPIFQYVKSEKIKEDKKYKDLKFKPWLKQQLTIKPKKQTSILDIAYKDTNKEIIMETLKKISDKYTNYARTKQSKNLSKTISFLESQSKGYKTSAENSFSNMISFAIDNDLNLISETSNRNNIEAIRVNSVNKIRNLKYQIMQIENLKNEPDTLLNYNKSLLSNFAKDASEIKTIISEYEKLESDIDKNKTFYKTNNENIKQLEVLKKSVERRMEKRALGFLKAELISAQASLEAANRPKDIILEFNFLKNAYFRDQKMLDQLENNIEILKLQLAKSIDPYEIITDITILDYPVGTNRRKIALVFSFVSFLISSIYLFAKEKIQGKIYSDEELINLIKIDLIDSLTISETNDFNESITLIAKNLIINNKIKKLKLLTSKNSELSQVKILSNKLRDNLKNTEVFTTKDLSDSIECDSLIVVLENGCVTKKEIKDLKRKLLLTNFSIMGLIILKR